MRRLSNSIISTFLIGIFAFFIFLYNRFLEKLFYIIGGKSYPPNSIFVLPVFYWLILLTYGLVYCWIFNQRIKRILVSVFSMGIGIKLAYLLLNLKIGLTKHNIFRNQGEVYTLYADIYFLAIIFIFFVINTIIVYKIFTRENGFTLKFGNKAVLEHIIFYSPLLIFSFYLLWHLINNRIWLGIFSSIISSIVSFCIMHSKRLKMKIYNLKDRVISICYNERITLAVLFAIAFVIRFIWGLRLLSITGNNYLIASDDGLTYDPFGALIAQGRASEIAGGAVYWGGMGYWYFLALIYKIFGLHNFPAVILFQSLLGALVPLCTYYIAKKIFNEIIGLSAALIVCFEMGLIFISGVIGMEALFVPMAMVTMAFLIYIVSRGLFKKKIFAFFAGLMFGLTNIARGEVLFFPFVLILLFFLYALLSKKLRLKQVILISLFLLLGLFLGVSIHAFRNFVYLGKFTIHTEQAAISFPAGGEENKILVQMGFNPFRNVLGSVLCFIKNPFIVLKVLSNSLFRNSFHYLFLQNFGQFDPFTVANVGYYREFNYPVYFLSYTCAFTIFGILYSFFKKEKRLLKSIILSYVLYTIFLYGLIYPRNPRYKAVLIPFFVIFFVYGVVVCIKRFLMERKA